MGAYNQEPTFEPVGTWPHGSFTTNRKRSPFKQIWQKTLDLLKRELRHLGAVNVKIGIDLPATMFRVDGWPRADARPRTPAVKLSFLANSLPGAPVRVFACDRFLYWQDNLKAIALGLEALRMVDRYGITQPGQQYAGFKALPATTSVEMSAHEAAELISIHTGIHRHAILESHNEARRAIRQAAADTHPDRTGSHEEFVKVQTAKTVLSTHHGVSL